LKEVFDVASNPTRDHMLVEPSLPVQTVQLSLAAIKKEIVEMQIEDWNLDRRE